MGYTALIALAERTLKEEHPVRAIKVLDGCPPDRRSWEWAYLRRLCSSPAVLPANPLVLQHQGGDRSGVWKGHPTGVWGLGFSPNGQILASNGGTKVNLWNVANGRQVGALLGHGDGGFNVAFSPDGGLVAGTSEDGALKIWGVPSGQALGRMDPKSGPLYGVAYSPTGSGSIRRGGIGTLRAWNAATGAQGAVIRAHPSYVQCLALSRDGLWLATGGLHDNLVKVWDAATGAAVSSFTNGGRIQDVAFSPDGRRLAAASHDGTVKILDPATGRELGALRGTKGRVWAVAFGPDARRIATGSADDPGVILWDSMNGERIFQLKTSTGVTDVAFSPDGHKLASTGWDGVIQLWDASPAPQASPKPAGSAR